MTDSLAQMIADAAGKPIDTFSVSDDGSNKQVLVSTKTYPQSMVNTEAEMVAVDAGVQAALPKDARWFRRNARSLMIGRSGLSNEQKIARMEQAIESLQAAVKIMKTGEIPEAKSINAPIDPTF